MGLVNKVVPLEQLEDEYVQWAEEMMQLSPLALRMIKAGRTLLFPSCPDSRERSDEDTTLSGSYTPRGKSPPAA